MSGSGAKRVRTCIGCGKQSDKVDLLRIVKAPDGAVSYDATGRRPGRGAYVCSVKCLTVALEGRKLQRALKGNVGQDGAAEVLAQIAAETMADEDDRRR